MSDLWARMDETGIYPAELKSYAVDGWQRLPSGTSIERAVRMMWVGEEWVMRPCIDPPVTARADDGVVVTFGTLPEQTEVSVTDASSGEELARLTGPAVEVELVDPGIYVIEVFAPLPWIPFDMRVTVE